MNEGKDGKDAKDGNGPQKETLSNPNPQDFGGDLSQYHIISVNDATPAIKHIVVMTSGDYAEREEWLMQDSDGNYTIAMVNQNGSWKRGVAISQGSHGVLSLGYVSPGAIQLPYYPYPGGH